MDESTKITNISTPLFDHLELFYKGKDHKLTKADLPFLLGRDAGHCQLVIDHPKASRLHCTLTVEKGQVGILDSSTNGTALQIGRADSIMVKDSFHPLTGQGCIQLGKTINAEDPNLIYYKMVFKRPD